MRRQDKNPKTRLPRSRHIHYHQKTYSNTYHKANEIMLSTMEVASVSALIMLSGFTWANPLDQFGVDLETRSPLQANGIQFLCTVFPEVCTNMCWGKLPLVPRPVQGGAWQLN